MPLPRDVHHLGARAARQAHSRSPSACAQTALLISPTPKSGEGFGFNVPNGVSSSPTFRSAMSECQKLLPTSGPLGNGAPPSKRTMAKLLRIARCTYARPMGPSVPRPVVQPPGALHARRVPGDNRLRRRLRCLLPHLRMNLQAPAYRQALTACGARRRSDSRMMRHDRRTQRAAPGSEKRSSSASQTTSQPRRV